MPRNPRWSEVCVGDGEAAVGSEGSGLRLTGVLSRGPPTAGLPPDLAVCDFFSAGALSSFGRVS